MGRRKKTQPTQDEEVGTQPEVEETQPTQDEVEAQPVVEAKAEATVEKKQPTQVEEVKSFTVKKLVKNPVRLSFNIVLRDYMPFTLNNLQLANKVFMATIERSIKQKLIERV